MAEALRGQGLDVTVADVDSQLVYQLSGQPPQCVVPMLHGAVGEDGSLRDVLDCLGLPFVGTAADSSRVAFDKAVAKSAVRAVGVHTPTAVALPHSMFRDLGAQQVLSAIVRRIGLPLVVKPSRGGSSLGVSVVRVKRDLPAAMISCFAYGDTALIESYVTGTEVAVSVLQRPDGTLRTLPAVEICPDSGNYDFASRYTAGATEFFTPARLAEPVTAECARIAELVFHTLGLRDLARVDLIVDESGTVQFLEVNVAPGCTETSLLPQAVQAAGLNLGAVFADLVAWAARRGS